MAFDLSRPPRKTGATPFAQGQEGARIMAKYGRPADFEKFKQRQVEFDKFMNMTGGTGNISGTVPRIEGKQFLAVREPKLTPVAPTFREAVGDFMRGFGNFTRNVGSKVSPLSFIPGVGLVSSLLQGIGSFNPTNTVNVNRVAPQPIMPRGGGGGGIDPMMMIQTEQYRSLNATQQSIYDMLIKQGLSHNEAYAQALRNQPKKETQFEPDYVTGIQSGGITTLQ